MIGGGRKEGGGAIVSEGPPELDASDLIQHVAPPLLRQRVGGGGGRGIQGVMGDSEAQRGGLILGRGRLELSLVLLLLRDQLIMEFSLPASKGHLQLTTGCVGVTVAQARESHWFDLVVLA